MRCLQWGLFASGGPPALLPSHTTTVPALQHLLKAGFGFSIGVTDIGSTYVWPSNLLAGNPEVRNVLDGTQQCHVDRAAETDTSETRIQIEHKDAGCVGAGWAHIVAVSKSNCIYETARQVDVSRPGSILSLTHTLSPSQGRVILLAAGEQHSVLISDSGMAYSWGRGECGQLGHGTRENAWCPKQLLYRGSGRGHVARIACGARHTLLLATDGHVYACGWGLYGQCGTGDTADELEALPVAGLGGLGICELSAGMSHSVALTSSGDVYAWGWNDAGQLGTGTDTTIEIVPQLLEAPELEGTICSVSCGARHTMALDHEGRIWSWGWNQYGQLGTGDTLNQRYPAATILPDQCVASHISCGWWHSNALVTMK
ncbi:hypothetical protein CYMTET_37910 [Cymbomonas tetramitiformis]|uniref:Ultraviolet-B receptor UVR8 n=1 Tax=Cymbomonas tetramitiformis TaxID=36881 RepID=A0AAE0F665_9CHLO|nr:hypothetical protein CYMTET_37910 [Cymbomonas tetramitiformis]